MAVRKRIPTGEGEFDLLLAKFECEMWRLSNPELNISAAQLATLATNAAAYHGWRLLKSQISDTKTSITNFVEFLFNGDKKDPLTPTPGLTFVVPTLPAKPGIERQTKEFIEYLEIQDNFTDAIGLDLGFYTEVGSGIAPEDRTAEFKVNDSFNYALIVSFSLQGQDALRLSYRVKGTTAWTKETLVTSPYTLEVTNLMQTATPSRSKCRRS